MLCGDLCGVQEEEEEEEEASSSHCLLRSRRSHSEDLDIVLRGPCTWLSFVLCLHVA